MPTRAFLSLGCRPLFLGASALATISMALWIFVYRGTLALGPPGMPASYWHAHEMIYGYVFAVIGGFLLTAVENWTGRPTLRGTALGAFALLWLIARIAWICPTPSAWRVAAVADGLFASWLLLALSRPIIATRQWAQLIVVSKVLLLLVGQMLVYVGLYRADGTWLRWGLYLGFYTAIAYITLISGRVMPLFIEKATHVTLPRGRTPWTTGWSHGLMILLVFSETFAPQAPGIALLAGGLCVLHTLRMAHWHTPALWRKPMLWILYLANAAIILGFILRIASVYGGLSPLMALHAFAVGGIGLMSAGMMARVTLGHTGRNVYQPPRMTNVVFGALLVALCTRVLLPMLWPAHYALWMLAAQVAWVLAFGALCLAFTPVWMRPAP